MVIWFGTDTDEFSELRHKVYEAHALINTNVLAILLGYRDTEHMTEYGPTAEAIERCKMLVGPNGATILKMLVLKHKVRLLVDVPDMFNRW